MVNVEIVHILIRNTHLQNRRHCSVQKASMQWGIKSNTWICVELMSWQLTTFLISAVGCDTVDHHLHLGDAMKDWNKSVWYGTYSRITYSQYHGVNGQPLSEKWMVRQDNIPPSSEERHVDSELGQIPAVSELTCKQASHSHKILNSTSIKCW